MVGAKGNEVKFDRLYVYVGVYACVLASVRVRVCVFKIKTKQNLARLIAALLSRLQTNSILREER